MARPRKTPDVNKIAEVARFVGETTPERTSPRPPRSKRGVDPKTFGQCCFKLEKDRHQKLRLYCIENEIEIGQFLSDMLAEKGF